MIGAIIGDIVGSRFEFNNHRSTDFELFAPESTFTDDTICTIAVADWLLHQPIQGLNETMHYWCRKYPSSYGTMFSQWIHNDGMGPYNSFGNGSAMRVSPVAWACDSYDDVLRISRASAEITHNHTEGIKGAQAIALGIHLLKRGWSKAEMLGRIKFRSGYNLYASCEHIRASNRFDETCQVTVPQAFQCFLESSDFESAIRLAVSIGGDSDTIAAITGSLAEAHYGIPEWMTQKAMAYLPDEMLTIINEFKTRFPHENQRLQPVQVLSR